MKVVFENDTIVVLYAADKLPKNQNFPFNWRRSARYYTINDRPIERVYVHQKGGGYARGFNGVMRTAAFFVRDPEYNSNGKWTGMGRGWPAYGYTYDIPYLPDVHNKRLIVYQTNHVDWVTWHSKGDNDASVAIGLQGLFRSRHLPPTRKMTHDGKPSKYQMAALESLLFDYLMPKYGLTIRDVRGHFEAPYPKPSCPGDDLERWILSQRGLITKNAELYTNPPVGHLDEWTLRQAALHALGHDIGNYGPKNNGVDGIPGEKTRLAIEAVERASGLDSDGVWDLSLESIVVNLLKREGISRQDLYQLC